MGLSKEYVNYKISTKKSLKCLTCDNFYPPGAHCEIVEGNISPEAVCDNWVIGGKRDQGKDKEFYQKEFKRNVDDIREQVKNAT